MTPQLLESVTDDRDTAMAHVSRTAGEPFLAAAKAFVLRYLAQHGQTSGEDLTAACRLAGIVPHDDRAFGPVYRRLSILGKIEKCGLVPRKRGHLTSGGNVWRLAQTALSPSHQGA